MRQLDERLRQVKNNVETELYTLFEDNHEVLGVKYKMYEEDFEFLLQYINFLKTEAAYFKKKYRISQRM